MALQFELAILIASRLTDPNILEQKNIGSKVKATDCSTYGSQIRSLFYWSRTIAFLEWKVKRSPLIYR